MVCSKKGRYRSYFRRTKLKCKFLEIRIKLAASDKNKKTLDLLFDEITPDQEWVKFDGDTVSYVQSNWAGVIRECLNDHAFPMQLFYEKPWVRDQ